MQSIRYVGSVLTCGRAIGRGRSSDSIQTDPQAPIPKPRGRSAQKRPKPDNSADGVTASGRDYHGKLKFNLNQSTRPYPPTVSPVQSADTRQGTGLRRFTHNPLISYCRLTHKPANSADGVAAGGRDCGGEVSSWPGARGGTPEPCTLNPEP